jgi:hypothetical protein
MLREHPVPRVRRYTDYKVLRKPTGQRAAEELYTISRDKIQCRAVSQIVNCSLQFWGSENGENGEQS